MSKLDTADKALDVVAKALAILAYVFVVIVSLGGRPRETR